MSLGGDDEPARTVQQTTNSSPWEGQQPYLKYGFEEAKKNYQSPSPSYFPNSTVVPFSNQTESALRSQEARATQGSPLNMGAQGELSKTLAGDYLNGGNPAYGAMVDRAVNPITKNFQQNVLPGIDAKFAMAGRGGSNIARASAYGNAADAYGNAIGNVTAPLAWQNYDAERGRMASAVGQAPALAANDYEDIAKLGQVGAIREGLAGQQLKDQIDRFNYNENLPDQKLRQLMTLISGGSFGGTQNATSPLTPGNPWLTALGVGSTAASTANTLKNLFG